MKKKIGVCCISDPENPKTWSGTPSNICDKFKRRDSFGASIFGLPHKSLKLAFLASLSALLKLEPHNSRLYRHAKLVREYHGLHISEQMLKSGLKYFLHLAGDRYLPLAQTPPGSKNFLLIDATWRYWKNSTLKKSYIDEVDADMAASYQAMDHIFSISEHTKLSLVEEYGISTDKITVVGTGLGTIKPYFGQKNYSSPTILFVAKERFEDKGGLSLFYAFKEARKKNENLKLWLVGDPNLQKLAIKEKNVTAFGFLPIKDLQLLFESASLFAMPASREPWGLVYLEAMSCKMPILGLRDKGAISEITQNGNFGYLIDRPTVSDISEALLNAFSNYEVMEKMGSSAQQYVMENFNWDRVADKILEKIEQY